MKRLIHKLCKKGKHVNGQYFPMTYCGEDAIEISFDRPDIGFSISEFNCPECTEAYALVALAEVP